MDNKAKDNLIIRKTVMIVIVVAILFTSGFLLGAVTAKIKELAPADTSVAATTVPTTETTTVPTTVTTTVPTTEATTTTEVTTTEATTTTETTVAEETTTEAAAEEKKETHWLIQILIDILEFCKQIKDFLISILQSL